MRIVLEVSRVDDPLVRDNFAKLLKALGGEALTNSQWKFFELTFTGAVTNQRVRHHLGFVPKDVLQTSKTGAGSVTWNYTLFDENFLDITTTGACVVRAFVGTYREANS